MSNARRFQPASLPFGVGSATGVWTKLCGVRDPETASALAELAPSAIGLNFFESSRRYVTPEKAAEIVRRLPNDIAAVGVFVNASVEQIVELVRVVNLDAIQLHGDEPPDAMARLKQMLPATGRVRAWRVGSEGLDSLAAHLAACERLDAMPDAVLIDAKVTGAYGGTGTTAPWGVLQEYPRDWPPLILAGGLTPENVADAIAAVRPYGVDTAGGVESEPGVKDPRRAAAFLAAVRASTKYQA